MLVTVKNVCYPVDNVEVSVNFYQDILGLPLQFVDGTRWAQFRLNGISFALSGRQETPDELRSQAVVTFEVENLESLVSVLQARGVNVSSIRSMNGHGKTCWFCDPSENVVQLFES